MKTGIGMFIFVFLAAMILVATQPALLHGASTTGGMVWDDFLDPGPYPGIVAAGPLSIYYDIGLKTPNCGGIPGNTDYLTTMYYTVRMRKYSTLYVFQGKMDEVCLGDTDAQGNEIKTFLRLVVAPRIFGTFTSFKVKSINYAQYSDEVERVWVADIEIAVKK